MKYQFKVLVEPVVEPVTVDEAKLYAHIDHSVEDTLIANWIKTARKEAENYQRRVYIRQTLQVTYDNYFPLMPLELPRPPLVSVRSIKYYDDENVEYSIDLSDFYIDICHTPGRIIFNKNFEWPNTITLRSIDSVKIVFIAGYDDKYNEELTTPEADSSIVPPGVKDAINLYCSFRNENRCAEDGDFPKQFYDLLYQERLYNND